MRYERESYLEAGRWSGWGEGWVVVLGEEWGEGLMVGCESQKLLTTFRSCCETIKYKRIETREEKTI